MKFSPHSAAPALPNPSLDRECHTWAAYLVGQTPTTYVVEKYRAAHEKRADCTAAPGFDRFLCAVAAQRPLFAKLADSYARVFVPAATLRRKLILLLAILESAPPAHRFLHSVDGTGKPALLLRLVGRGVGFVLCFLLATIFFFPVHLALAGTSRTTSGGQ